MSKLLELIGDMQDYGYDITTEKKVSNKTLADYLEFHIVGVEPSVPFDQDETENAKRNFTAGREKMRLEVLCYLKGVKERSMSPPYFAYMSEIISQVEQL